MTSVHIAGNVFVNVPFFTFTFRCETWKNWEKSRTWLVNRSHGVVRCKLSYLSGSCLCMHLHNMKTFLALMELKCLNMFFCGGQRRNENETSDNEKHNFPALGACSANRTMKTMECQTKIHLSASINAILYRKSRNIFSNENFDIVALLCRDYRGMWLPSFRSPDRCGKKAADTCYYAE